MALPDTRDLTLIDGISPLPASTGNALQDRSIYTQRALSGGNLVVIDDFTGSAVDASKWATISGSGVVTVANSKATLAPLFASGTRDAAIATAGLGIGTAPFRFAALVTLNNFGSGDPNSGFQCGVGTYVFPGFIAGTLELTFGMVDNNTVAVWQAKGPAGVVATGPSFSTNPTLLEISRDINGLVSWSVNGVVIAQASYPGAFDAASGMVIDCYHELGGSVAISVDVDLAKLVVERYPVAPTSGPPTPTPHFESGRVAFDGATNGPDGTTRTRRVNFATSFGIGGAANFKFNTTVGPGNVHTRASVSNIDANGGYMDVYVEDATFVGPVSWQAYL